MVKCLWVYTLNRGPEFLDYFDHLGVVVDDDNMTKPYWRKEEFPDYKENRKPKPEVINTLASIGLQYANSIKSHVHYVSHPGLEADDIAGALVSIKRLMDKLNPEFERDIYLYTVDSDWLQLVGDGVYWCNTGPWEPRLRSVDEAIEWTKRRLKVEISSPREIVQVKSQQGDKSDNLPPGSDEDLIDLLNPRLKTYHIPELWKLLKYIYQDVYQTPNLDHLHRSKSYIQKKGFNLS